MTRPIPVASRCLAGQARKGQARWKARRRQPGRHCAVYGLADSGKKVQNHREEGSARSPARDPGGRRADATPSFEARDGKRKNRPGTGKTVTRADLSEIVYQRVGLSRTEFGGTRPVGSGRDLRRGRRGRRSTSVSAPSSSDRKASGSDATRRRASRCRSFRAASWSSSRPTFSRPRSTARTVPERRTKPAASGVPAHQGE